MRAAHAVDGVNLAVAKGEVLGLVGESGCGKTTLGRMIAGILPPSAGAALIDGAPAMSGGKRPVKTTTRVQMVFQDPFGSLDPRMRVGDIVSEGPVAHGIVSAQDARGDAERWLATVGLDASAARRYPHQFSGGQRQRIAIARALAMRPDALVCDEPVASLDVSIQAQIVNLLQDLKRDFGMSILFVSHNLAVVRRLCDRVIVLYLGKPVEIAPTEALYAGPAHPYTRGLLAAVPIPDPDIQPGRLGTTLSGELPSPLAPPSGCVFRTRCPHAIERCAHEAPAMQAFGIERQVACLRLGEIVEP
jgi:peptide/nickel transport system ATP-binding protein